MKKSIMILILFVSSFVHGQIDLFTDASFVGVHSGVQISYPIEDKLIIGASYGYNWTQYLLSDRIDLVLGWKCDEWVQLEGSFGVITGYDLQSDKLAQRNKTAVFHYDLGLKGHFCNNLFATVHVAFPGFIKLGLGIRLRPYKQLTIWDKQF